MLVPLSLLALASIPSTIAAPSLARRWNNDQLLPAPSGGILKNDPVYVAASDFDFETFVSFPNTPDALPENNLCPLQNLVLQVEHLEYTLFGYGLNRWSDADFVAQNLTSDDRCA